MEPPRIKRRPADQPESKIYGTAACQALFRSRSRDIIKVYVNKKRVEMFAPLLKSCAIAKKAYHIVDDVDLERLTESTHHGGICIVAREPDEKSFHALLGELKRTKNPQCLLFLDGVQNPHNVGNILRMCAHFGLPYLLTCDPNFRRVPPATRRVSEGGAELVRIVRTDNTLQALRQLKSAGFKIVATSSHYSKNLFLTALPQKTIFVIGSEEHGISRTFAELADDEIAIAGSGMIESLNVASACAILVSEFVRQYPVRPL